MTTITLGQANPLVYKRTYPDPDVLDRMDIDALRGEAERHGIPWEYPVGDGIEAYSEGSLRSVLAEHQVASVSPDVPAAVTTVRTSPDSTFAQTLDEIGRIVARHGDPPEWVDGDDPLLVEVVARMFDAAVGAPADVEARFYTQHGPAGVGPDGPIAPSKGGGGIAPLLGFMLAIHLLAFWLSLHLRTTVGRDHQAGVCFDTASTGTGIYSPAEFIGVTEDATAPVVGDTTLTAELTTEGFTRAQVAYAHTAGTATVTQTKTFTMSGGTSRTLRHAGLFTLIAVGILVYKTAIPSPPTLVSGDSMAVTWTFTL